MNNKAIVIGRFLISMLVLFVVKGKKFTIQLLVVVYLLFLLLNPAIAADSPIQVEKNDAELNIPEGIFFNIEVKSDTEINHVTLMYGTSERTCQEKLSKHDIPLDPAKEQTLSWQMEFLKSGVLPQGMEVWWQWEISNTTGDILRTEKKTIIIIDQRHNWHSRTNKNLTVYWYQGNDSFGAQLLAIAANSMRRIEGDMGILFDDPIYLTVYPTSNELLEVLIHTQDWAGGAAFPNFNAIVMNIAPGNFEWAQEVIPHELTHLVVEARIFNCQGVIIPTWLNEGLAVFAEGSNSTINKQVVYQALLFNNLPSLNSLSGRFSAYSEEANLSYLQSEMVVEYLISEYGAHKMDELLTAIQNGKVIDDALGEVYRFNTAELDGRWRQSLGFSALDSSNLIPEAIVTKTQIPTLALYTAPVQPAPTSTIPISTASLTPFSSFTTTPVVTITPSPRLKVGDKSVDIKQLAGILFILLFLIFIGFIFLLTRRRKA